MSQYENPTQAVASFNGQKTPMGSDPQTYPPSYIVYDSLINSKASGAKFVNKVMMQTPLSQVKHLQLVYASLPNVAAGGGVGASDDYYVIRIKGASKESVPAGNFIQTELANGHMHYPTIDVPPVQSAQFVLQNDAFNQTTFAFTVGRKLFYQTNANYPLKMYFPTGITKLSEFEFEFFNSKGEAVNFTNTSRVLLCFEALATGQS